MIIVRLAGGLGNQMFQYAMGRSFAHKLKTDFKLDRTVFKTYKLRHYSLGCFRLKPIFAKDEEVRSFLRYAKFPFSLLPLSFRYKIAKMVNKQVMEEKHRCFDPLIFTNYGDIYLKGTWASEKYFIDIKDIILKDFSFRIAPSKRNRKLMDQIKISNSVSIHVRRADYVSSKDINEYLGTCNLNYYLKCISIIAAKIKKTVFFIFSDDSSWVKQNFNLKYPINFVTHNLDKDYEDLRLMSLCKHNIIANSTFSWWGAWLNQNPEKIVLAPKKWFKKPPANAKDIIPKSWIQT